MWTRQLTKNHVYFHSSLQWNDQTLTKRVFMRMRRAVCNYYSESCLTKGDQHGLASAANIENTKRLVLHSGDSVTVNHHSISVGLSCVKKLHSHFVGQIWQWNTSGTFPLRECFQLLNAPTDGFVGFVFKLFLSTARDFIFFVDFTL